MSIKDDLDFPGEEEYVRQLAAAWGLTGLDVIHPSFSLQEWIAEHLGTMEIGDDVHSRTAGLSREAFYPLIDRWVAEHHCDGALLGLRAEESPGRNMNRVTHGTIYAHSDGVLRCTPLADWRGLDVYGYLLSHGIEPLHVYRCCGLAARPDKVRKSWWFPGAHVNYGATVWLRMYYPSLYHRLCELWPIAGSRA
jgi:3'-phosphoadenosine 5'-phosphosulfate sulfotransferase (PAPS reductase)/FAD synthetase